MHELYPKEVVIKNRIEKVIFHIEDGETQTLTFNKEGLIIKEVESKNWNSKDTSEIFYHYEENLLSEVVHINKSNGDTLSFDKYIYKNGKLKIIEGKVLSNRETTIFHYNETGKIETSKSIMTSSYLQDTLQIDTKIYDEKERLINLTRIVGDKEDNYSWDYQKKTIVLKKKFEIYKEEETEQVIEFDDNLQITKFTKKINLPNQASRELITEMKYDENDLFLEMTIDGQKIIEAKYIKK